MSHKARRYLVIAQRFFGRMHDRQRENGLAVETVRRAPPEPAIARGSGHGFAARVPLRKEANAGK